MGLRSVPLKGVVLEPVMYRLHELVVFFWRGDVGLGVVYVRRDTVGAVARQNVIRILACSAWPYIRQTDRQVRDTGDSSAVLPDRGVGRQGNVHPPPGYLSLNLKTKK